MEGIRKQRFGEFLQTEAGRIITVVWNPQGEMQTAGMGGSSLTASRDWKGQNRSRELWLCPSVLSLPPHPPTPPPELEIQPMEDGVENVLTMSTLPCEGIQTH